MYRWGRGGAGWYLHMYIKLTTYNTEYRIEAKLMYLKLPMYLLFCMGFERNDFDGGKSISMEGVGTWNGFPRIKIITSRAIYTTGTVH